MNNTDKKLLETPIWAMCAVVLLISFVLPLSSLPDWPLCWFYHATHIPCPGCGLTRAFLSISHGQWTEAWNFNPFSFVWYSLAVYGFLRPLLLRKVSFISTPLEKIIGWNGFFPSLVALMFLVWVIRISRYFI